MRIDKVIHRKVSTDTYQSHLNELAKRFSTIEDLQEQGNKFWFTAATKDEDYEFRPQVVIHKSNLGVGFLVLFLCPSCSRKCKSLYILNSHLRCRICHGLTYKKVDRRQLKIRQLALNKQMRLKYLESGRWSLIKQAFEAEKLYWDTRYHNAT